MVCDYVFNLRENFILWRNFCFEYKCYCEIKFRVVFFLFLVLDVGGFVLVVFFLVKILFFVGVFGDEFIVFDNIFLWEVILS